MELEGRPLQGRDEVLLLSGDRRVKGDLPVHVRHSASGEKGLPLTRALSELWVLPVIEPRA